VRNQQPLFSRYLCTNGDGSGTDNFIGNHAATEAYIQPAAEQIFYLHLLIVSLEDGSGMKAEQYGLLAALTNGVQIREEDSAGTITDFTDGVPIKTNAQWAALCYDADIKDWGTSPTQELFVARYTFANHGRGIYLDGDRGGKLVVALNDNFTGLISHRFLVEGYIYRIDKPNP
jgi:hypothetical protein